MKILGITAEYDPFHNGHAYHLEAAKEAVSPDATVCVMSGDITQRGHVAVLDKWTRAEIALKHGLDMVLELPFLYAVSPAKTFAEGAVDILVQTGVSHVAFGCEAEKPDKLTELARLQISEEQRIEELTRSEMEAGISYVKARQIASSKVLGDELTVLSITPNNILAIEYIKRLIFWEEKGIKVETVPVVRKSSGYKDVAEDMAGGSAIRTMLDAGWDVSRFLPYNQNEDVDSPWTAASDAKARMLQQLKGIALRNDPESIASTRYIGEGIENKLIREIIDAENYDDLLKRMTSKRYTTSTIRRMLIYMLMGITGHQADAIHDKRELYGRILALGSKGRQLISGSRESITLPFIANINKTEGLTEPILQSLEFDIRAADLFNLITGRDMHDNSDHRKKPTIR